MSSRSRQMRLPPRHRAASRCVEATSLADTRIDPFHLLFLSSAFPMRRALRRQSPSDDRLASGPPAAWQGIYFKDLLVLTCQTLNKMRDEDEQRKERAFFRVTCSFLMTICEDALYRKRIFSLAGQHARKNIVFIMIG